MVSQVPILCDRGWWSEPSLKIGRDVSLLKKDLKCSKNTNLTRPGWDTHAPSCDIPRTLLLCLLYPTTRWKNLVFLSPCAFHLTLDFCQIIWSLWWYKFSSSLLRSWARLTSVLSHCFLSTSLLWIAKSTLPNTCLFHHFPAFLISLMACVMSKCTRLCLLSMLLKIAWSDFSSSQEL